MRLTNKLSTATGRTQPSGVPSVFFTTKSINTEMPLTHTLEPFDSTLIFQRFGMTLVHWYVDLIATRPVDWS